MGEVVKSGHLSKYSDSVFGNKWKRVYVTLNRDSWIRWYERQGDSQPKRSIQLKKVAPYLAFGEATLNIPFKPEVPKASIDRLIAIPHESNRNTRLSFFLCNTDDEIKSWVDSIMKTLPPPPQYQQQPPAPSPGGPQPPGYDGRQQPQYAHPQNAPPPGGPSPHYGGPPSYPGPPGAPPPGYPTQGGYPGAPPMPPGAGGPPIGFNLGGGPPGGYPAPQPHPGGAYPQQPGGYPPPPPPGAAGYHQAPPHGYPQAAYPQAPPGAAYPQQGGYYGQPPGAYHQGYPQAMPAQVVHGQPAQQVIYVDGKKKKKGLMSKKGMVGLAAGAAGAYMVGRAMHHPLGWGGGWGWRGSWSSLSSFGSCGSFGSFGSFSD